MQKEKFDICIVVFSDLRFDARAKNLVETLVAAGKKVIVYSILSPKNEKEHTVSTDQYTDNKGDYTNVIIDVPHDKRMILKLIPFIKSVKKHIKKQTFTTFWASDLYSLPICKYLKKNIQIIYDSREIYSELSTLHSSKIRQNILISIEKYFIKKVKVLVTSGERDSIYIKEKYKLTIPSVEIKNFPKNKEYVKSELIRERFNIPQEKTIVLYQGALLDGRGIVPAMKAIALSDDFVLVILGDGLFKNELQKQVDTLKINNKVYFTGNIDYDLLHQWTCSGDIGLCNIEPLTISYQLALPNKLFEYILAKIPVLATDLPALREVVDETNCGIIISEKNDPDEILKALNQIKLSINDYKNNIEKVQHKFVYESQTNLILSIV